jgi:PAS domain S-box-containing protein
VDLLAEIMRVPFAMVRRVAPPNIKVFVSSKSKENPYEPDVAALSTGLYCDTVVKTRRPLLVRDARQDKRWKSNPEAKLGMISYLGVPISWPDGEIFGTICVLDNKEHEYSELYLRLLLQWRDVLQDDLRTVATLRRQLEEREAKIRRLVEANIIGIFIWNFDGCILDANDAFLRMVGYDREDLVSGLVRWTDLTPPEWLDRDLRQWLPKLKTTGSLQPIEKEYFRKDGSRVPVLIGAAQFDETGSEGVAFVLDLTERKRAEEALRESEEKWKAVFENNPTMFFMLDATGTIISVNPLGAEQLGYRVDELIDGPVQTLFHQADREAAQRNTALCLQQLGRALTWELRKIRKNGEMLWVRETARAMLIKNRPVVLIVCDDITERKRAEYLTGQVFESSPDGISVVGRDYRYQRVNPVYERNWGMSAEKIVGKHLAEVLGIEPFEQTIKPNLERCFNGEDVRYAEWFASSLGRRYLAVTYSPLRPNSERVEAALVVTHDLTDHVLASEALRAAQAELAHVNRITTMGQLTASIAHEVNQPIAAAITNAQAALRWLGAQPPDLDEVGQALRRIVENGKRASDVIGRIRALIKKAPPRRRRFDLNEAILDVIALTRSEILRHGVSLQTQLASGLPLIEGDRIQLQQVLLNLLMNAVEAMSGIGEGTRALQISTEAEATGGVLVTVRDSGPGLDPANEDRVFEAFYTTKPEGMGMGLAISQSIIEAHGGRMWATANEPRGAVFQFTVPPEREESASPEHASQTPVV